MRDSDGRVRPLEMISFFRSYSSGNASPCTAQRSLGGQAKRVSSVGSTDGFSRVMEESRSPVVFESALDTRASDNTPLRKYSRSLLHESQVVRVRRICGEGSCDHRHSGKPPVPSHVTQPTFLNAKSGPVRAVQPPVISSPYEALPQLHAITRPPTGDSGSDLRAGQDLLRPSVSAASRGSESSILLGLESSYGGGWRPASPTHSTLGACRDVASIRSLMARKSQGLSVPEEAFERWRGVVKRNPAQASKK